VKHIVLIIALIFSFSLGASEKLRLIAEQNIPTGEKYKETEIGGLSGIVFDQNKKRFYAVCDDRSQINNARVYEFDFKLDEKNFSINPTNVLILKNKDGQPFKKMMVDFEGITIVNNEFVLSSEGGLNHVPTAILPEIMRFSRDGNYLGSLEIPEKFLPTKDFDSKQGARDNLVFEALSSTPEGKYIFAGMEESLLQDGATSNPKYASTTRIVLYNDLKPIKEFAYLLDVVPSIPVGGLTVGETGLVDFAAIDENNFYSMERAYLMLAKKQVIKIFKNHIDDKTTDISKIESIKKFKPTIVTKTLFANIEDLGVKPDNIEGLCFGPLLANGHQTLIAISDNNFSKTQRTEVLALEIIP
jgi:hypothetical protein